MSADLEALVARSLARALVPPKKKTRVKIVRRHDAAHLRSVVLADRCCVGIKARAVLGLFLIQRRRLKASCNSRYGVRLPNCA